MPEMMQVARLHGIREVRVEDLPKPTPGPGELLLKVEACAVCGSDIRIFNFGNDRVQYPAITGHEIAGRIVAVGEGVQGWAPGDRIAVGADVPSMEDDWAKNGLGNLSDSNYAVGYQFPGGFAQFCLLNPLTVRFGPVARIPDHVSASEGSLAEPLACCLNGLERAFMAPGKTVLIIGAGPIGILLARSAAAFGASLVVLADRQQNRVRQAKELGVAQVFHSEEISCRELAGRFSKDRQGFDLVFTACSSSKAQEQAIEAVAKRGVVNFFGGLPGDTRKISFYSNLIHYKEAYLTGSHGATPRQHKLALDLIASGRIEVASLISHRFPLAEIRQAFAVAEGCAGLKVAIKPWQ